MCSTVQLVARVHYIQSRYVQVIVRCAALQVCCQYHISHRGCCSIQRRTGEVLRGDDRPRDRYLASQVQAGYAYLASPNYAQRQRLLTNTIPTSRCHMAVTSTAASHPPAPAALSPAKATAPSDYRHEPSVSNSKTICNDAQEYQLLWSR